MEDILLNKNTVKNVILQEKQNKKKQKKPSWSVVAIQRVAGLIFFYVN